MSLGLVAYDDSEDSENESDSEEKLPSNKTLAQNKEVSATSKTIVNGSGHISDEEEVPNSSTHDIDEEDEQINSSDKSVNLHLPESKLSLINTDIDIKCLTSGSKRSGPVKITIPSLNEVIDESEAPSKKKLKPSQKGSGLFALLPSPKSSLVPQSVANKKPVTPAPRKPSPAPVKKTIQARAPVTTKPSSLISYEDSGDEEEISGAVDFFSLESKEKDVAPAAVDFNIDIPEMSSTIRNEVEGASVATSSASIGNWLSGQPSVRAEGVSSQPATSSYPQQTEGTQSNFAYSTSEFMTVGTNDLELDQQAMQQLCGRRDRLKMQEVSLIDVSGDAIMPDSREWLTKQLTEEVAHRPSHKRKDGPTSQQKRKHQITYLAYQAKENELELKNQWANNRMSRKQTQAKYGF